MIQILFILALAFSSYAGTNIKHLVLDQLDICILFNNGKMKCWGYPPWKPTQDGPFKPLDVTLNGKVKKIASGRHLFCALMESGDVWCKGKSPDAYRVDLPVSAKDLEGEEKHFCAILNSGEVWCWGKLLLITKKRIRKILMKLRELAAQFKLLLQLMVGVLWKIMEGPNVRAKTSMLSLVEESQMESLRKVNCWGTGFNHLGNGWGIHTDPYEFKAP